MLPAEQHRFLDALRALLGSSHVLHLAEDCAPYLTDWRKRYQGRALAVVLPGDAAQVAGVVQLCALHGVGV
ncbi:MAG: hypothetical protein B7X36_12855, partial [Thiomonas sp. 14-64-326]